jgi:hypothetical protein
MNVFILLFTLPLFARINSKLLLDKSYPRDNTYCSVNGKKMELMIRGESKFTELKDNGYGELIFYRPIKRKPKLLINDRFQSETYKLFHGRNIICSKSHAFFLDESTLSVLFLKEDKPFKDKLALQLFDAETLRPKDFIQTNFTADKAKKIHQGFAFRTFQETYRRDAGKIDINGESYIYHQKEFPIWVHYTSKGVITSSELTFESFPWKNYFKDFHDFKKTTGWDPSNNKFNHEVIYFAINHSTQKSCILIQEKIQNLHGKEDWRCQAM